MQQPVPPQQDLPPQKNLPVTTAAIPAKKTKNTEENTMFIDHWLLLFNQQEDEDNENSHILSNTKSA